MIPIDDVTKRTWTLQLIRSAAQWAAGYFVSLAVVAAAVAGLDLDPDTLEGALRTVIELAVFIGYIAAVRALETYVHPFFGWLNGWRAELDYHKPDAIEVTGHRVD